MIKAIRIRKFMIVSFILILTLPWLFYVVAHFLETNTFRLELDDKQEDLETIMHGIETNTQNWTDPDWQNQFSEQAEEMNVDVVILSASNQKIIQTNSDEPPAFANKEEFTIIEDGQVIGRVAVYHSYSRTTPMIASFIGLLLAFFVVGFRVRKMIIKPLEKMSQNARQIAEGDLDVQLPVSRITEIAEVRDGFHVMVNGLKEAFQKQAKLEEERRFVIAAVAHDLRTPLFALRGYLDGLEQGIADSPEKRAKYLAVCKEKSAQLDRLVEDLFTFTKMEYVKAELNEVVDLTQVLKQSIDSLRPQAQEKHISLIADNLINGCIIKGDAHLLERAMSNLLDNAIRHTPSYGKVLVSLGEDSNSVTFAVQDTGSGFISEELQRVFEPLYRGEESRSRSTGGAGLGLTISQRIIRLHGGELQAGNHPDGGALLSGWLPVGDNERKASYKLYRTS